MSFRLSFLLQFAHSFQVSDPRDKVYALLGLAADRRKLKVPVDYNLKVEDLYALVTSRIFATQPDLNLLYHNLGKKSLSLPSWVPDWSTWVFGSSGVTVDHLYSASGSTKPRVLVHGAENKLELAGCLVDSITSLGQPIGPQYYRHGPEGAADRRSWLGEQERLARDCDPYPDGSDVAEVLWRTLIGNMTLLGSLAGDEYRAYFDAHMNCSKHVSVRERDMAREFVDAVRRRSRTRCLATTSRRYLAAVPEDSEVGDWVSMFHGARFLFVIRESKEKEENFVYVGPAYLHGLMQGEVLRADWYEKRTISLI